MLSPLTPSSSATITVADRDMRPGLDFRRYGIAVIAFLALPSLLLAGFVLAVDPYYVFGSPSWRGFNAVRPFYETHVLAAKPYQVWRTRPSSVALGSSRAEVGLDPSHPGWVNADTFNFGMPASTSYEVLLAYLHAQAVGRPLKQVVVGIDFFGFNIFFPSNQEQNAARWAGNGVDEFAAFLKAELAGRPRQQNDKPSAGPSAQSVKGGGGTAREVPPEAENWDEALYLKINPDVAAAVARHLYKSGREHYELVGRAEGREGGIIPANWNEALYLRVNPDVRSEIDRGTFLNGYHHYLAAGRAERRSGGTIPGNWDEALYLQINPDVANEIKRGTFLNGYHHYLAAGRVEGRVGGIRPDNWDEALYLAINPDVRREIARGTFRSGYHHYLAAGRVEKRRGAFGIPRDWDEASYLQINPDVQLEIKRGTFLNGYHHYLATGHAERRLGGFPPPDWDEAGYIAANPGVAVAIARGDFRSGFLHYAMVGRSQGLLGGFPPADSMEWVRLRWPALNKTMFRLGELYRFVISETALKDAISTIQQQSRRPEFDDRGVRTFAAQDEELRKLGGVGPVLRIRLGGGGWGPWLTLPKLMYCFTNTETGMTMFDPFRFMLRRAYADDVDMRLFITPLHSVIRELLSGLGLGERYEFWLKELVRINEEEAARAGRRPMPLWDFSDSNTITQEPVPRMGDPTPMRWYWEHSHYRKATGDLILDRLFEYRDPRRPVPADFGVRLSSANVDAHIARTRATLAAWSAANAELVDPIVHAARTLNTRANLRTRQAEATCW